MRCTKHDTRNCVESPCHDGLLIRDAAHVDAALHALRPAA